MSIIPFLFHFFFFLCYFPFFLSNQFPLITSTGPKSHSFYFLLLIFTLSLISCLGENDDNQFRKKRKTTGQGLRLVVADVATPGLLVLVGAGGRPRLDLLALSSEPMRSSLGGHGHAPRGARPSTMERPGRSSPSGHGGH
jgi:hypothetical protein